MATGITNFNVADGRGNGIVTAKAGNVIFVSGDILRTDDDATVFARFSVNGEKLSEETRYMGYNESWHVYVMTAMPNKDSTFMLEVGDNATPSVVEDIQSRMITLDTGGTTTGPKFTIYSIVTSPTPPPPGQAFNMWVQVTNIGETGMGFLKVYDPDRNKYYVTDTLDHDAGEKIQYLYSITTDVETIQLLVIVGTGTTVQNPPGQKVIMASGGGLLNFSVLVQDSVSKAPIPNATVVVDSKSTSTTNGSGKAAFTNQASGDHNLDVSASGYTSRSATITLSYNDESFTVALSSGGGGDGGGTNGSLNGYVSDSSSQAIIASASVLIVDANMQTTTNSKGYYSFQSVKAGSYNVQASKTGYNSSSADVSIVVNKTTGKDFYLKKIPTDGGDGDDGGDGGDGAGTGSLIGAVTDDDAKKPISGVVINIIQLNKATLTDTYGAYRIDGITVGTYIVGASMTGYDVSTASVIITTDTVTKQDFALKPSKGGFQLPEDWWMWAGLGVGAVAVAGGAAIALSKKNNNRKKR